MFAFAVAVLAGVGTDVLTRSYREGSVRRWMGWSFAAVALVLVVLWLFGRGRLPPTDAAIRTSSFLWPTVQVALGLAVVGVLTVAHKRRPAHSSGGSGFPGGLGKGVGLTLLACETAFLVAAGAPFWSSSSTFLVPTAAEVSLEHAVGSSAVGFGVHSCSVPGQLGIPQDLNVAYDVQEFDVYDPVTPKVLFGSWEDATGQPAGVGNPVSVFCPAVTSAAEARRYGVAFVLEPLGAAGPEGAVFDERVGDESLYRIRGAATATLTPAPTGSMPGPGAAGTPVSIDRLDAASWKIVTQSATTQVLRLHLLDVPGWQATIDGRPLPLERFSGAMLQAQLPAGSHTVVLRYWPNTFSIGLGLAACSARDC